MLMMHLTLTGDTMQVMQKVKHQEQVVHGVLGQEHGLVLI